MTWYRMSLAPGQADRIRDLLANALTRNRQGAFAGITTLREMGFSRLRMQKTAIEVRLVHHLHAEFVYLNDGALRLYRALGGTTKVDAVSRSLPDAQFVGHSISDVWRKERP